MKKKIALVCGLLAVLALVWTGVKNLNVMAEDTVSGDEGDSEAPSGRSAEDVSEKSASEKDVSGNDVSGDDVSGNDASPKTVRSVEDMLAEDGVLYVMRTSDGNNLGMVPIVAGNAVVLLNESGMTTYQGDYEPEAAGAFQLKLEEENAKAAADGFLHDWAFYKEPMLKSYDWPDGVEAAGRFAFARSGLNSISIPEGVKTISKGAFYHCDNLTEVTIPASVTTIEENAFSHTPWLDHWMEGAGDEEADSENTADDFLIVGDGILLAYRGEEENPEIPEGVKSIVPGVLKTE